MEEEVEEEEEEEEELTSSKGSHSDSRDETLEFPMDEREEEEGESGRAFLSGPAMAVLFIIICSIALNSRRPNGGLLMMMRGTLNKRRSAFYLVPEFSKWA